MTNGSLMKVEKIAESSHYSPCSILQYFWPALSDNWSWKPTFGHFESGRFTQVLLYKMCWQVLTVNTVKLFIAQKTCLRWSKELDSYMWKFGPFKRIFEKLIFDHSHKAYLRNKFNFWSVYGIMNTSGLLLGKWSLYLYLHFIINI